MEDEKLKDVKSNVIYITGFPNEFSKSEFQGKHTYKTPNLHGNSHLGNDLRISKQLYHFYFLNF